MRRILILNIIVALVVFRVSGQETAQVPSFAMQFDQLAGQLASITDANIYNGEVAEWMEESYEALTDPSNRASLKGYKFSNVWHRDIKGDTVLAILNTHQHELVWYAVNNGNVTMFRERLHPFKNLVIQPEGNGFSLNDSLPNKKQQLLWIRNVRMRHQMEIMSDTRYPEELKEAEYERFKKSLKEWLKTDRASSFSWLSRMKELKSEKYNLRVLSYAVTFEDFSQIFECVVIENNIEVSYATDAKRDFYKKVQERQVQTLRQWYGAVYHEVIPIIVNKKVYFTLLGYRGTDGLVKQRVIDILDTNGRGDPRFGAPLFTHTQRNSKGKETEIKYYRRVFRYSAEANMMMRFEPRIKTLVMDHLSPTKMMFTGEWRYYGPDMSYDGYVLDEEGWIYKDDVEIYDKATNTDTDKTMQRRRAR